MIIQAIRYTLPDSDEAFDAVLKKSLIDILQVMLADPELENRRLALTTLNSAAHNKPDLIIPNLGIIKPALIREVMMGPFKHKVDDGLEVRKVCYVAVPCILINVLLTLTLRVLMKHFIP
jgi:cullin-associated NEDD8-dissociated protein 1